MLRRMGLMLLVGMLSLSLGLHWAFLQSVAWVGMIASYSTRCTFVEAVHKTLDGQHACTLCKIVESGKKSDEKQGGQNLVPKLDPFLAPDRIQLIARITANTPQLCILPHGILGEPPPFPPPRGFHAVA